MRAVAFVLLTLVPMPAVAQEGLDTLVPLVTLYGPEGSAPGFDVAGIRCAGLDYAADAWGESHGTGRPSRAAMQDAENNLAAAFQHRQNNGVEIVLAQTSVEDDLFRVMGLYTAVFEANVAANRRWDAGSLIDGDRTYCGFLNK